MTFTNKCLDESHSRKLANTALAFVTSAPGKLNGSLWIGGVAKKPNPLSLYFHMMFPLLPPVDSAWRSSILILIKASAASHSAVMSDIWIAGHPSGA
jgi:hypothetical protein